ncbi:MAG: 4Fe-4S dicluster domain-containing protein [Kiritimatiellae bacterium]|nr:4Fe-4S dicluster domain-containing protein [Kiritimatiellia bacterium]
MFARFHRLICRTWVRWLVRVVCTGCAFWLVWAHLLPGVSEVRFGTGTLPACSPFVALLSLCAGTLGGVLLYALPVALFSFLSPRFFCRWMCPAGCCQDVLAKVRCRIIRAVPFRGMWRLAPVFVGIGIAAALFGYPLFLCLDPLVLFHNGWGLVGLLIGAVLVPYLWCAKLCPLGALQDFLYRIPRALVRLFRRGEGEHGAKEPQGQLGRRVFLGGLIGVAYRSVLPPHEARGAIRPPMSVDESRFLRLCARCGACVRACPVRLIRYGGAGNGIAATLAPEVHFGMEYCNPSCNECGKVCPTGAIPRFEREAKAEKPMGIARVSDESCRAANGQECGTCVNSCPYGALDLGWDAVNMVSHVLIDPKACVGCGCCEFVCPVIPKAIVVVPLGAVPAPERTGEGKQ